MHLKELIFVIAFKLMPTWLIQPGYLLTRWLQDLAHYILRMFIQLLANYHVCKLSRAKSHCQD